MKNDDLLNFLLALQKECDGAIPFQRYMQEALYHRKFGYYSAQIREVGAGGDFSTSATLDQGLSIAIAAWITQRAKELKWKRIPVIEIGAGSGTLCASVLRNLDWKTRWHTNYMIHETSPILRKRQESLLRWRGVRWINSLEKSLKFLNGKALIFSNELVDAFPCRLFEKSSEGWFEIGVHLNENGSLTETVLGSMSGDPWFEQFALLPIGQRVERLDVYQEWLSTWGSHWKEGALLTIDYGDTAEHLYSGRKEGSLRAYFRHQRFIGRDLYARFGKQDLTADVNFSDLINWGNLLGWKNTSLNTQREFDAKWLPQKNRPARSDRFSIPGDAGDAFKVLEQTPG